MALPLILIVDDNPENLTVLGELMQPRHAVRVANSGVRALRLARLKSIKPPRHLGTGCRRCWPSAGAASTRPWSMPWPTAWPSPRRPLPASARSAPACMAEPGRPAPAPDAGALRAAQADAQRCQAIMALSRDGVIMVDLDGRVDDLNAANADLLGYSAAALRAMPLQDWLVGWSPEHQLDSLGRDEPASTLREMQFRHCDGGLLDVEVSLARMLLDGRPAENALDGRWLSVNPGLCLDAGMDDHLSKPVHVDKLYAMLRHWLGATRLVRPGARLAANAAPADAPTPARLPDLTLTPPADLAEPGLTMSRALIRAGALEAALDRPASGLQEAEAALLDAGAAAVQPAAAALARHDYDGALLALHGLRHPAGGADQPPGAR